VAERVAQGDASLRCLRVCGDTQKDGDRRKAVEAEKLPLRRLKVGVHADRASCSCMEDESVIHSPPSADFCFCCVYDGHGGLHAAQFCRERLHHNVMASESFARGDSQAALLEGFRKTEADLLREQDEEHTRRRQSPPSPQDDAQSCCGSTALVLLIRAEQLHLAWLGDCRAVLSREAAPVMLTRDHSVRCARERARVLADGGEVEDDRLWGFLEVSRAFGDLDSATGRKPRGLSGCPELASQPIEAGDEFVVIGSDGLWNVVDPADAVRLARAELQVYNDAAMASEKLVEVALKRHADDNVTAMVVCLNRIASPANPEVRRPRLPLLQRRSSRAAETPARPARSAPAPPEL